MSSVLRLSQIPTYYIINKIDFDKITPKIVLNWKHRILVQDFLIDSKKYNLSTREKSDMIKSYETNYMISCFYQVKFIYIKFIGIFTV